jgi:glycosyltransferase involved in cell wall biosynthesis
MPLTIEFYKDPYGISIVLLVLFTAIQLFYYWYYFARLAFFKEKTSPSAENMPPVSVIICARNEYDNLVENLPLILEQDYPDFEVVVVNDFSHDESYFLLKSYESKYANFKVIHLRENVNFFEGKKLALAVGIKSAKNEYILLTDADCKPSGKHWIRCMSKEFTPGKDIVLGYGGYNEAPGFLNRLIRFDTMTIAMQFMGMALAGRPYMGVGRNLAYRKSLFFKTGGFTSHYKIKSGDDDLFINQAATGKNTAIALNNECMTFSAPENNFDAWFHQKKRHLSTGKYYKFSDKFILGLHTLSGILFYITLLMSILTAPSVNAALIVVAMFILRTATLVLLYYKVGRKLKETKLFLYSPIFDVIFLFLNPIFAISNLFYKENKWK